MALKKFKRLVQRENILRDFKQHAHFMRPGEKDRIKRSIAGKRRVKKLLPRPIDGVIPTPKRVSRRSELPAIAFEDLPAAQQPAPPKAASPKAAAAGE